MHESNLANLILESDDEVRVGCLRAGSAAMPQRLLDSIMLGRCSHEFSWPRRAADGHYYQVCLLCAAEYEYDWKTMRRAERVERKAPEAGTATRQGHTHPRKPAWTPRARRLKLNTPVRYRGKEMGAWVNGRIENLSQSGVFLHGPQQLPSNSLVEMVFEMPEEISGQKNSSVLCQGRITRTKQGHDSDEVVELAASILDYKFLHQNQE